MLQNTVNKSTITASTLGFLCQASAGVSSFGDMPQHKPTNSLSGFGLVNIEIAMVAIKHTDQAIVERQKFPAMTEVKWIVPMFVK